MTILNKMSSKRKKLGLKNSGLKKNRPKKLLGAMKTPKKSMKNVELDSVSSLVDAFRAAVKQLGVKTDQPSAYALNDSNHLNEILRLCFTKFPLMWQKKAGTNLSELNEIKWKRLRPHVKSYLQNLTLFLLEIQNADVLCTVLKHLTHVVEYFHFFNSLSRRLLKVLITIWSTKNESARILAFASIIKLVRRKSDTFMSVAFKKLYLAYVKSVKFVTSAALPSISFMQRSYAELCGLNPQLAYQHAFVYIRQMAIHLRNAIISKKEEQVSAIYNWQYIQCLYLWARVLAANSKNEILKPLIYPLIQTALGCARLLPTTKYIPLRFHCARAILILSEEANIFVPLLPVVLEALEITDFKKKHVRQSLKPFDFECMLKLSPSQLEENAFRDAVIQSVIEVVLTALHCHCGSVAFPELSYTCCYQLKSFCKSCRLPSLTQPIKEFVDKIQEHSNWLQNERASVPLDLMDENGDVTAFEIRASIRKDSPLEKYYDTYQKMKERERKLIAEAPVIEEKKTQKAEKLQTKRKHQQNLKIGPKIKISKKAKIEIPTEIDDADDIVNDLNLSDIDD